MYSLLGRLITLFHLHSSLNLVLTKNDEFQMVEMEGIVACVKVVFQNLCG
jgi:hypothetical protein